MKNITRVYEEILGKAENLFTECITELNDDELSELDAFHMQEVYLLQKDDDYIGRVRANSFVLEIGYSEIREGSFALLTANHKGM